MTGEQLGTVGFVGLGNMGWPMARHLRAGGVDLVLHDARAGQAARFAAEHGGRVATDLAELARASKVVITMLPNGQVVREVVLGGGRAPGLLEGLGDGGDPGRHGLVRPAGLRRDRAGAAPPRGARCSTRRCRAR